MTRLGPWLYEISSALLTPVIALLLALLAVTLIALGRVVREAIARRRVGADAAALQRDLFAATPGVARLDAFFDRPRGTDLVRRFARDGDAMRAISLATLDALLAQAELRAAASVARLGLVARAAPILGLMGTLIPMGPALVAMSRGDVATMSSSLVVAFTTTVVGLVAGLVASSLATVRRHWYAADVAVLEHVVACQEERARAAEESFAAARARRPLGERDARPLPDLGDPPFADDGPDAARADTSDHSGARANGAGGRR